MTSVIAEELFLSLGPWAQLDTEDARGQVLDICEAVFGTTRMQIIEDIIRDTDTGVGWSPVVDIDRCPEMWLDWLGQFVGVQPTLGLDEVTKRSKIKLHSSWKTGTPGALVAEIQAVLTDTKTVLLNERLGGNAWALGVRTWDSETPSDAAVLEAIAKQKPAGITLDYDSIPFDSWTYSDLRFSYDLYSDVKAHFTTYTDLKTDNPH